jgi:hypothetical protein
VVDQEQANNQRFFLKGSLVDPQVRATFLPALPSDCFAIDFPGRAIIPSEGSLQPRVARAKSVKGTSATFHRVRSETPLRPL